MSYDDLLQENKRLKLALESSNSPLAYINSPESSSFVLDDEGPNVFEDQLFEPTQESFPSIAKRWPNILLPSKSCSLALLEFDRVWNSWVHAALDHPKFELEHAQFWDNFESGSSLDDLDPAWLALYFAVIAVRQYYLIPYRITYSNMLSN